VAYNSSQQEFEELRAAALETCQGVEEGEAQAGSSLASRLRALGGHVSRRMRRALHVGVQKALVVVGSHYQVYFKTVASGYVGLYKAMIKRILVIILNRNPSKLMQAMQ
jgi:hypothetical protein